MAQTSFYQIKPSGDSAIDVVFSEQIDPQINALVHANHQHLAAHMLAGVIELVPTYGSLLVHFDSLTVSNLEVSDWLQRNLIANLETKPFERNLVEIPTIYGCEYGPDLENVARLNHLLPEDVIRIHSGRDYPVYMMGFTPGYPYLGGLDPAIAAPRLETPRTLVRAGSVGIANTQTGIYSIDSPGGWQIIGWTPRKLFDAAGDPPFLLSPGSLIRFVRISADEAAHGI